MHKKILRWQLDHLSNPLSYTLVVACVYSEKCDPAPYFAKNATGWKRETFVEDCKKPNLFYKKEKFLKDEFKNGTGVNVDDLLGSDLWVEIMKVNSIDTFLQDQDFDSPGEIRTTCEKIFNDYLDEPCFEDDKKIGKIYGKRGIMYLNQMRNLGRNVGTYEKWTEGTANHFWFGKNAMRCISKRVENLLVVEQTDEKYKKSVINLIENFNFSNLQIEMLRYAICQSKGGDCPASLNKAVYIWGKGKGTGKTTIAATLVSILNGEQDHFNIRNYESTLAQELGFKDFVSPMIASCRAVLLDEAMPRDSSKSYDSLKNRITSDGVKIRFIHKNQIQMHAKANYYFTSNHPLEYFVQDESERRFFEFCIESRYKTLTYKKIYSLFLDFAQQCKRIEDWSTWYDSMLNDTEVKGLQSRNKEDIRSYFETPLFYEQISGGSSQVSIGTFYIQVAMFDKIASKQVIRECLVDLFGEPYRPSTWRKTEVLEGLEKLSKTDNSEQLKFDDVPY